jgi:hypothetical protein
MASRQIRHDTTGASPVGITIGVVMILIGLPFLYFGQFLELLTGTIACEGASCPGYWTAAAPLIADAVIGFIFIIVGVIVAWRV